MLHHRVLCPLKNKAVYIAAVVLALKYVFGTGYFAGCSHCGAHPLFDQSFKVPLYAITAI